MSSLILGDDYHLASILLCYTSVHSKSCYDGYSQGGGVIPEEGHSEADHEVSNKMGAFAGWTAFLLEAAEHTPWVAQLPAKTIVFSTRTFADYQKCREDGSGVPMCLVSAPISTAKHLGVEIALFSSALRVSSSLPPWLLVTQGVLVFGETANAFFPHVDSRVRNKCSAERSRSRLGTWKAGEMLVHWFLRKEVPLIASYKQR